MLTQVSAAFCIPEVNGPGIEGTRSSFIGRSGARNRCRDPLDVVATKDFEEFSMSLGAIPIVILIIFLLGGLSGQFRGDG
jgi:hypothetical protein